jgi:hypothetical protein
VCVCVCVCVCVSLSVCVTACVRLARSPLLYSGSLLLDPGDALLDPDLNPPELRLLREAWCLGGSRGGRLELSEFAPLLATGDEGASVVLPVGPTALLTSPLVQSKGWVGSRRVGSAARGEPQGDRGRGRKRFPSFPARASPLPSPPTKPSPPGVHGAASLRLLLLLCSAPGLCLLVPVKVNRAIVNHLSLPESIQGGRFI